MIIRGGKDIMLFKRMKMGKRRRFYKNEASKISKGDLKRLARRGGISRISAPALDEAKLCLVAFLKRIVAKSYYYCLHARRNTISVNDIVYGLKTEGITYYA